MEEITTKQCSRCLEFKTLDCFYLKKRKNGTFAVRAYCINCHSSEMQKYREENKEEIKEYKIQYYEENKEKLRAKNADNYSKNGKRWKTNRKNAHKQRITDCEIMFCKICQKDKDAVSFAWDSLNICRVCENENRVKEEQGKIQKNPEEYFKQKREKNKEYRNNPKNKEKRKVSIKKYNQKPQVRIQQSLRENVKRIFKFAGRKKSLKTVDLIGCDSVFFQQYIISQLKSGMTIDNYGEWQLDHIIPMTLFDCESPEELAICCNYKNFQPLWAYENENIKSDWWNGVRVRNIPKTIIKHSSLLTMVEELEANCDI